MENLTQTYGVVKPNVLPIALPGYKVVIFENTTDGTKLIAILNSGDKPFKKKFNLFSPHSKYTCYAVASDCKLNFDFNADMMLSHQHQTFTLNCSVYYHVSDPGAMTLAFNTDPISRIRDEIKKRLQINILQSKIRIEEIRDSFYALKDKILPNATLNQLHDFVRAFGIIINQIDMSYKIPEKFLKPDLKKEDYYLEKETEFIEADEKRKKAEEEEKEKLRHQHALRKIEHEHEKEELIHKHDLQTLSNEQDKLDTYHKEEMEDVKGIHALKRDMPKRLITSIDNAIEHIDGPGSLERVADSALGVIDKVINKFQNNNSNSNGNQIAPPYNPINVLAAESSSPLAEAKELLLKILTKVQNSSGQPEERKALLASTTHLLAEIQLEENANPILIDQYIKELNKYTIKYAKIFTPSVMEQISEFTDTFSTFKQQINQLYRHTKVDFPKRCLLEQELELSIQLTIEKPLESVVAQLVSLPMLDSKEPIKLTLHVTAPGFRIDKARKTMSVPVNDDSEKVTFKMKPLSAGNQLVEVEIYFNALRIGYFGLEIQVEEVSYG